MPFHRRASHERRWRPEQALLPHISFEDRLVHIRNVRDFIFHSPEDYTPGYRNNTYHLDRLERVWFVLAPFTRDWRGLAHSFLSFGFSDAQYISISVEARREAGQRYSLLKGALRQYELMYVIGEERDLIGLRAVTWDTPVYLYPMRATAEQAQGVFLGMLRRAQKLEQRKEFYNTFTNNCTTNILQAVNAIAAPPIPFGLKILLPGYSDALAHERGLIDTELSLKAARASFLINARAKAAIGQPDFSCRIRG
ncbi:MAG: DUF4105 domain-containing protein [Chloroflexota bacterium]|nr:DUF4105 domain-containing protein [Chloroflexota bacterium]